MKPSRFANALPGLASLGLGIVFCILLFAYGVTQEVPIGQLEGTVILAETGKPLPEAEVGLSVKGDDNARDRYVTADKKGHFRFRNLKVGEYIINVSAQEHHAKGHLVVVLEGRTIKVSLKLDPNEPYLKMYASQRVWIPGDIPQLEMHGFRTSEKVHVEVDRVAFQELIGGGRFNQVVTALRTQDGFSVPATFAKFSSREIEFEHKVKNKDSEGAFVEPLSIPNLPEGFYWIRCSGNGVKGAAYINVSHIALVTKTTQGRALAYVTDLVTGKPIPSATVWTQRDAGGLQKATTDHDGLVETSYAAPKDQSDSRACLIAVSGKSTASVGVYTAEEAENSGDAKFVLYTERPIYRPGDDVQFKGIVRKKTGQVLVPPTAGTVDIQINDTDDQPIAKFPLTVSAHGTFSGHFTTSKEAGPGLYRIVAKGYGGRGSHFVNMVAYRKPEIAMQVTSLRPYYLIGDKAQVAIQCSYYFGGPVVGAKLHVNVYASPASDRDAEDEDQANRSAYDGGDLSTRIEATTDSKGQAIVQFNTKAANDSASPLSDLDFSVNVSGTDASNKYVNSTGTVHVVRGAYNLSVVSENYLASPGQTIDLLVKARSNEPNHSPASGRSLTIESASEEWQDNKSRLIQRGQTKAVTGIDGIVHVPVVAAAPGTMVFKVYSRDDAGRLLTAEEHVYVLGGKWHAEADQSKFEVVTDKRHYKLGETAHIMLRSLVSGGSALLTAQTNVVLWKKVVPLNGLVTMVDVPIQSNFLPNCFISVAYVHKKKFYEGDSRLLVDPGSEKLKIAVTSDKKEYQPGGAARLTVHTTDATGKPISSEVSVGVVDESIYAIREDDFDIYESFYPKRTNSVVTSYSFSEVYLDGGDKGGANVAVRKKFLDTAAWIPAIQTDINGLATVNVTLPDNLTEWRATAVGITDNTSVGKATTKFRAKKNLMVRLAMPEFLVQQDQRQMSVIVTNDTGADRDVHFSIESKGITILGEHGQTIHVSATQPTNLTFQLQSGNPGQAVVTAKAWIDGGASDGVEQSFPVLAHGVPISQTWAAEVTDAKDFTVTVGSLMDRSTGRLKIGVSGSLAGNLVSALDGLIGFPYGCVEQTMSRFMPSIVVAKTTHDLGIPNAHIDQQVPKIAADSMIRLARMQHEDGGWGWWENDTSDPFMTALVLDGLDRCKTAGYEIHKVDIDKALTWCDKRTQAKEWRNDSLRSQCYVLYVLAKYGKRHEARLAYSHLLLRNTTPADRATLVLATNEFGPDFRAERDRLLDRLGGLAHQGPLGAYWDSSDWDWGSESTALALTAYMTVRPNDPIVPRIVRYLIANRRGDMWDSTRDTAYSVVGLSMYLNHSHELAGKFEAHVLVEGKLVRTFSIDSKVVDALPTSLEIPISDLHPGPNSIRIEKVGVGTCYTILDLKGTEIQPTIAASEPVPGLNIVRKYYRLEARKLEDGTMQLLPTRKPVVSAESGDTIRVEITVTSNKFRQFIMVEDPIPSNCRVTDREQLDEGEEWAFWWDRLVIRDDKVAFFIHNLQKGTQTLTYTMRAEGLGLAHALPTTLSNMYDASERARGSETLMEVK